MTTKSVFVIDDAKLKNLGGGSVSSFCKRFKIERGKLYGLRNKSHVQEGTEAQMIVERLISIGVAEYRNVEEAKESQ